MHNPTRDPEVARREVIRARVHLDFMVSIDIEQIHKRHFTSAAMKVQPSPPTPDWLADIYKRFRRGQTKTPPPADP